MRTATVAVHRTVTALPVTAARTAPAPHTATARGRRTRMSMAAALPTTITVERLTQTHTAALLPAKQGTVQPTRTTTERRRTIPLTRTTGIIRQPLTTA